MPGFTHFDDSGASRMVDIGSKLVTERSARAQACVRMELATANMIRQRGLAKGDVLEVARLAGIMATKRTAELIPLCHPLALDSAQIHFFWDEESLLRIESRVTLSGKTGAEMEALTAAAIAALTVYDMCKSVDRGMLIESIRLLEKDGGKSGHFVSES